MRLVTRSNNTITTAVTHSRANPPTVPPTIAPTFGTGFVISVVVAALGISVVVATLSIVGVAEEGVVVDVGLVVGGGSLPVNIGSPSGAVVSPADVK